MCDLLGEMVFSMSVDERVWIVARWRKLSISTPFTIKCDEM